MLFPDSVVYLFTNPNVDNLPVFVIGMVRWSESEAGRESTERLLRVDVE